MKKLFILSTVMIFSLFFSVNTVFADGHHGCGDGYYWQAAAIGLGFGMLGSAIANSCQPERVTVVEHHTYYEPAPPPRYCESRHVWVPPVTERVWNPGHYEYDRWVPGQYIIIEREPGYWAEERVCREYR
jgi:hypothetical protein